jgi:type I restriction enzyme S subunit
MKTESLKVDDKLHQGWVIATLKDLGDYINGRAFKPTEWKEQGLPIVRIQNLNNPHAKFNYSDIEHEDKYKLKNGDLLVAWSASLGVYIWNKGEAWLNQHIFKVEVNENLVTKKFLYYAIQEAILELYLKAHGTGMVHVTKPVFESHPIALPPLNEQKRIVAKLEKLLAKVNESCDRLSRIPTILKRFRQSVLASACSGRLTADWRKSHPDIEPAEELLKKDTGSEINEFLQSWCFVSVGDVIKELRYGTSKKCSYDKQSHPILRIPNVVQGVIDSSDLKYTELSDKEYETLRLKIGDILMIRSNGSVSLIGKTAMVTQSEEGFAYAGYLIRLRPNLSLIDPRYLNYYLSSYEIRLQIELPARSTSGVNNINSTEVKKLAIAVPPLEEQKEIVKRVEALFRKCDLIEQRYLKAKAYTDKLTQSILAKAFRGELVPQDPNDEPAEVLLERIREEKTLSEKSTKSKKTSKSKTT